MTDTDTIETNLHITITRKPINGELRITGTGSTGTPISSFTANDVRRNRIEYVHDASETLSDDFDVIISDGTHDQFYYLNERRSQPLTVKIKINPIDNKKPRLEENRKITTLLGNIPGLPIGRKAAFISKRNLEASDKDSVEITYSITVQPAFGKIVKHVKGAKFVEEGLETFTQQDIDNLSILYVLGSNKKVTEDMFIFDLIDQGGNSLNNQKFRLNWCYVSLASEEYIVDEAKDKFLTVTLLRRGYTGETSFVTMQITNQTAEVGTDVTSKIASQVQFNPGQTKAHWNLRLIPDNIYENNETLKVSIKEPVYSLTEEPVDTYVIITDEGDQATLSFELKKVKVRETEANFKLKIKRTGDLTKESYVQCYTVEGKGNATATGPTPLETYGDYIARPQDHTGIVLFQVGEDEQFCEILIIDDSLYEGPENFFVRLADPFHSYIESGKNEVEVVIEPDFEDEPMFFFTSPIYTADESDKFVEVQVWRSGTDLRNKSSVMVSTRQLSKLPVGFEGSKNVGLAKAGQDYTGLSTILTFDNDDTMRTVKVSIDDDTGNPKLEGLEVFEILLTMPLGGVLGTQNTSVIQIDDTESDSKLEVS